MVQRCGGEQVEYVLDFYVGKKKKNGGGGSRRGADTGPGAGGLDFYLDVRPKLNSWEGVRTRALAAFRGCGGE